MWLGVEGGGGSPRTDSGARRNQAPARATSGGFDRLNVTKHAVLKTTCKQILEHDRVFMKKLLSTKRPMDASGLIREHFWSLTQQFLIPLESFAARLMPLKRLINPFTKVRQQQCRDDHCREKYLLTLSNSSSFKGAKFKAVQTGRIHAVVAKGIATCPPITQRQLASTVQVRNSGVHAEVLKECRF